MALDLLSRSSNSVVGSSNQLKRGRSPSAEAASEEGARTCKRHCPSLTDCEATPDVPYDSDCSMTLVSDRTSLSAESPCQRKDSAFVRSRSNTAAFASPSSTSATTIDDVATFDPKVSNDSVVDENGNLLLAPGDYLTSRFRVKEQCGQGSFGMVWACDDLLEQQKVAIKVIRSIPGCGEDAQHEINVLRTVNNSDPDNVHGCTQLLTEFDYHNHKCLVFPYYSESVYDFMRSNSFQPFPATQIWSLAKQLLESVAYLHAQSIAHLDLKPENIMLEDTQDVSWRLSSPEHMYRILHRTDVQLIDFGSAVSGDEQADKVPMTTCYYRSPEIVMDQPYSPASDLWSVACILLELHTGRPLFDPRSDLEHLAQIEAVIGPMPSQLVPSVRTTRPSYFHDDGTLVQKLSSIPKLDEMLNYPSSYESHNDRFLQLLRALLKWDPSKRMSARDALKLPYFSLPPDKFPI